MYTPETFKVSDENTIDNFLRKYSFATLVTTRDQQIEATHIPVLIAPDRKSISFHIASANPIKTFLIPESSVLLIFTGPHGYVSPRWYTQPNVPTWNYSAVHMYGRVRKTLEPQEVFNDLEKLVSQYESKDFLEKMFKGSDLNIVNKLIPAIIGYEIEVTDVQAKFKLSQNRDEASRENVIKELQKSTRASDRDLAEIMISRK